MLDMKFSGTVDFGAKVTKFWRFFLAEFRRKYLCTVMPSLFRRWLRSYALFMCAIIISKLLITTEEFHRLNVTKCRLLHEHRGKTSKDA